MDNISNEQQFTEKGSKLEGLNIIDQLQSDPHSQASQSTQKKGRRGRKARILCEHHSHHDHYDSMQAHVFSEWHKSIVEDDVFEGEEDENLWIIDDTNAIEIIEALNYHHNDYLNEDEIVEFIEEDQVDQKEAKIIEPARKTWADLKFKVYKLLVEDKKIEFKDLIHQHHSMHVERVSRFLNILSREISDQPAIPSQVKDWFLGEIKFTKQKINENTLFTSQIEQQKLAFLKERTIGG